MIKYCIVILNIYLISTSYKIIHIFKDVVVNLKQKRKIHNKALKIFFQENSNNILFMNCKKKSDDNL